MTLWMQHEMFFIDAMAMANGVSAFIVIYFMQVVTAGSGFDSHIAVLQLVQRGLYTLLAAALLMNAVHIYFDAVLPPLNGAFVEMSFFMVSFVSFLRHRMAPKLPGSTDAVWPLTSIMRR
jgi:hypothetical protein